jgi:hypothetical protein
VRHGVALILELRAIATRPSTGFGVNGIRESWRSAAR